MGHILIIITNTYNENEQSEQRENKGEWKSKENKFSNISYKSMQDKEAFLKYKINIRGIGNFLCQINQNNAFS